MPDTTALDLRVLFLKLLDHNELFKWDEFKQYATHKDPDIRRAVASREDCPLTLLEQFADDCDATVLAWAAGNLAAPRLVFEKAFYFNKKVNWAPRLSACGNPNLPADMASQYMSFDWPELLAYIGTETATLDALRYGADITPDTKSIEDGPDWNKELRVVARKQLQQRLTPPKE